MTPSRPPSRIHAGSVSDEIMPPIRGAVRIVHGPPYVTRLTTTIAGNTHANRANGITIAMPYERWKRVVVQPLAAKTRMLIRPGSHRIAFGGSVNQYGPT